VYGTSAFYIGSGIVGGVLRSTNETATRVGEMTRRRLTGARAQDIPVEAARVVPTFDWRQVQRWGIDPSRLPAGADIRFRTPTPWETYRHYIVGAVVVVAGQSMLIAGLLTQRTHRRRAEQIIRSREATLRTNYQRIRQLAGDLINAQETSRAAIARDLHDGICQQLVGVSMAISGLKCSSRHAEDAHTQQALAAVEHEALRVVESIRRLSHDLHPAALQLVGIDAALRAHCIEVEQQHDVQVEFHTAGDMGHLRPHVALCLFRIVQEALRNGAVHGGARRLAVSMAMREYGEQLELIVSDDGRGFDLDAVRRNGTGLGLVSMEERAHVIGGDVRIITGPGRGTMIRVRVPS
jgi:signal transduction histidine kinase